MAISNPNLILVNFLIGTKLFFNKYFTFLVFKSSDSFFVSVAKIATDKMAFILLSHANYPHNELMKTLISEGHYTVF